MSAEQKNMDRVQLVMKIQDGFGLGMADLADILRVPRQDFVDWLNRRNADQTDPRVERLSSMADWWASHANRGIGPIMRDTRLLSPRFGGRALIDLLRADALDEQALNAALAEAYLQIGRVGPEAASRLPAVAPSDEAPPVRAAHDRGNVVHLPARRQA